MIIAGTGHRPDKLVPGHPKAGYLNSELRVWQKLAELIDRYPQKELIAGEYQRKPGLCCAIGACLVESGRPADGGTQGVVSALWSAYWTDDPSDAFFTAVENVVDTVTRVNDDYHVFGSAEAERRSRYVHMRRFIREKAGLPAD